MSGDCENSKDLEFRYESDATSSFLVIGCRNRVLEFQAKMLENNAIKYVVPLETVKSEGNCHFYYNITSKISLLMYLKRYKLSRVEFLKLLLNLSSCINNSAGYLLSASNFLFDPEYLYIEPDTMEVRLIYIPAKLVGHAGATLQTLVSEVLMQHINVAGFDGGNLVQRILSEVKSEMFNIKSFTIVINELLYGEEADRVPTQLPEQNFCNKTLENSRKKDKIEEIQEYKENKENKESKGDIDAKVSLPLILPAVLLQFVMGGVIFICRGFLDNVGENRTATYAAVVMIVIAIDVLVFRKLQASKLFRADSLNRTQETTQKDKQGLGDDKSQKPGVIQLCRPEKTAGTILQSPFNSSGQSERTESSAERAFERLKKLTGSTKQEKTKVSGCDIQCVNGARDTKDVLTEESVHYKRETVTQLYGETLEREYDTDTGNIDHMDKEVQEDIMARYIQKTEILGNHTKRVHVLKSKGRFAGERDIVIDREEIIIGRLQGHVDHVLLNNAVGKLHAELICRNGSCFVKDLNSINGTFINDIRIESNKEVELKNNDSLLFANSEYVYKCG